MATAEDLSDAEAFLNRLRNKSVLAPVPKRPPRCKKEEVPALSRVNSRGSSRAESRGESRGNSRNSSRGSARSNRGGLNDDDGEHDELEERARRWSGAVRGDWRWEGRPGHRDVIASAVMVQANQGISRPSVLT